MLRHGFDPLVQENHQRREEGPLTGNRESCFFDPLRRSSTPRSRARARSSSPTRRQCPSRRTPLSGESLTMISLPGGRRREGRRFGQADGQARKPRRCTGPRLSQRGSSWHGDLGKELLCAVPSTVLAPWRRVGSPCVPAMRRCTAQDRTARDRTRPPPLLVPARLQAGERREAHVARLRLDGDRADAGHGRARARGDRRPAGRQGASGRGREAGDTS